MLMHGQPSAATEHDTAAEGVAAMIILDWPPCSL